MNMFWKELWIVLLDHCKNNGLLLSMRRSYVIPRALGIIADQREITRSPISLITCLPGQRDPVWTFRILDNLVW